MVVCLCQLGYTKVESHCITGSKSERAGSRGKITEEVPKET